MTDYSGLVERMRAYPASRLCVQLADALEAQAARIAELKAPLCIGETTIRLLAKEGACDWVDGRAVVAADELFKRDPYARISELEVAFREAIKEVSRCSRECWRYEARIAELEAASKAYADVRKPAPR